MKRGILFLVLLLVAMSAWANLKYSLVNVSCNSRIEMETLLRQGFDVQAGIGIKNNAVQVVASQYDLQKMTQLGHQYSVIHEDLTAYLQTRLTQPRERNLQIGQGSMGGYFTNDEITDFVDSLYQVHSNIMSAPITIGVTGEGRAIKAYKISDNPGSDENEPEVLIIGLHHAREGMSIVSNLYYTQWLVENYNQDLLATYLVNEREIWFVPILNVDGYVYNQQIAPNGGGMWRKNKRDNDNNGSFNPNQDGVDLNRNYGFEWGFDDNGSSPDPTAETYRGPSAFSEGETQTIRDFCIAHEFRTSFSLHTFGSYLIYPGHANGDPMPDQELFRDYAATMTQENGYTYGNDMETVNYTTNGGSDNWMYAEQTFKPKIISFTPEVGNSQDNFWAPTARILPLAQGMLFPQQYISLVAGNYLKVENCRVNDTAQGDGNLFGEAGESFDIYFTVKNKGWNDNIANISATLTCDNPAVTINAGTANIASLNALAETEIMFHVTLAANMPSGQNVNFGIHFTNTTGYNLTEIYSHNFGTPFVVFYDNAEKGTEKWTPSLTWGTTDELAASGTHSFTDSPYGNYADNTSTRFSLTTPLNLSFATTAFLDYKIRWDLEKDFDKAQIELRSPAGAWNAVEGEYTIEGCGIGTQIPGEPVYNAFRNLRWFDEKISLANVLGDQVSFRFNLASDEGVNEDGVYLDDIMVVAYSDTPMAPVIAWVTDNMENTSSTGPYPIQAIAGDAQGLNAVTLKYSTNNTTFTPVAMTHAQTHFFAGNIPAMPMNTTVWYYVEASDNNGNTVNSATYSFMVTAQPPVIGIDATELNFSITGFGTDETSLNITNTGLLPLDYTITGAAIIPNLNRADNSQRKQADLSTIASEIKKQNPQFSMSSSTVQQPPREMELMITDELDELTGSYVDIAEVYGELADDQINFEIFLDNTINWNATLFIVSFDVDQNINTGVYPPAFGIGSIHNDIGSEKELIVDCSGQLGLGIGAFMTENTGGNVVGVATLTLNTSSISLNIPYELLNDNDQNVNFSILSVPSQQSNRFDYAPGVGHATFGLPGIPSWVQFSPESGHLLYNQTQEINVQVTSDCLIDGTYQAELKVGSNDPVHPLITIPVTIVVDGVGNNDNSPALVKNGLQQNYPNPFNPETTIKFSVAKQSHVALDIYNIKGQKVTQLTNTSFEPGTHSVIWKGTDSTGKKVGSGIFFCSLKVNDKVINTRKMLLIK